MLGKEAEFFLKHLVEHLAMKWGKSHGAVMSLVRTRLSCNSPCYHALCFVALEQDGDH